MGSLVVRRLAIDDARRSKPFPQPSVELICTDAKTEPKIKTYSDVRKLKSVIGRPKAEDSLFNPDEPLSEAIRIGEQGRETEDVSDLLSEPEQAWRVSVFCRRTAEREGHGHRRRTAGVPSVFEKIGGQEDQVTATCWIR
jgi:hypothetical protein